MVRIYVGNLPFSAAYNDLMDAFSTYGTVHNLEIITDRNTGRSRGFAFLEMPDTEARDAIRALDGADYDGRALEVYEAPTRRGRARSSSFERPQGNTDTIRTWRQS